MWSEAHVFFMYLCALPKYKMASLNFFFFSLSLYATDDKDNDFRNWIILGSP